MTTVEVAAMGWVPGFARGYVKDIRVRWALEEAGLSYDSILVDDDTRASTAYRAWQPFGQVPAFRDETVALFESGAIVLYLAQNSEALAPPDQAGQARVASWIFAATTSVQPHVDNHADLRSLIPEDRRAAIDEPLIARLDALRVALGDKDYLESRFTAGDLIMTTVLREVDADILARFPTLAAYRDRCEERPAFGRALAAHLADLRDEP